MLITLATCLVAIQSAAQPLEDHEEWLTAIAAAPFDEPIHVTSEERRNAIDGDVYAIIQFPFETLNEELRSASAWCEIVFLHLNVKACVHTGSGQQGASSLRIYIGRKYYQPPEAAERVELRLDITEQTDNRLTMALIGDQGPYGTRDFHLHLVAVPYIDNQSLVHLHYSLGHGGFTRITMGMYFTFAGRHRVGFTADDYDQDGNPVFVRGVRGMIERNVMRFYLALQTHFESLDVPQDEWLGERLQRWFELTERYPRQLRELEASEYLNQKYREYEHQQRLQAAE